MRASSAAIVGLGLTGCQMLPDFPIPPCVERTGGAYVMIEVGETSFSTWSTNDAFIDTAIGHVQNGTTQVPNFLQVIPEPDCADPQWSWHVDPQAMEWADVTIEACDATPEHIEENRDEWIATIGSWCPWSAVPVGVIDQR